MKIIRIFSSLVIATIFISCADSIVTDVPTVFDNLPDENMRAKFSSIQDNVFNTSCALSGCHAGAVSPNLSEGEAYSNIVNQFGFGPLSYVDPGNPQTSYLFRKITGENISGSQMPLGGVPLSQTVIDSIEAWIISGAPNN